MDENTALELWIFGEGDVSLTDLLIYGFPKLMCFSELLKK